MSKIIFKDIRKCSLEQKKRIRKIRNQKKVRKFMYTDHIISEKEHQTWFENIQGDNSNIFFLILMNNLILGCVSANKINWIHKTSGWAFYLDENYRGGLGAAVEYHFINFVFNKLKLKKLNSEVIETNDTLINMHKNFGFIEEGIIKYNIYKNKRRLNVFLLGMTDKEWKIKKKIISKENKFILNKFKIEIEYENE
mgnify:CR=1 FL=1